jgi:hypothetical protein
MRSARLRLEGASALVAAAAAVAAAAVAVAEGGSMIQHGDVRSGGRATRMLPTEEALVDAAGAAAAAAVALSCCGICSVSTRASTVSADGGAIVASA